MSGRSPNPEGPRNLPSTHDDDGKQLAALLDTARSVAAEEFQRSERIDAKARHQLTVVGALFAVVMTTTAGVLNALISRRAASRPDALAMLFGATSDPIDWWVYPSLAMAALGSIGCLAMAFLESAKVWKVQPVKQIDTETLESYVTHAANGKLAISKNLVRVFVKIIDARRYANKQRVRAMKRASVWAVRCGLVSLLQLGVSFLALLTQ